ncbi:hypothetical protein IW148_004086 [Coemansia sp. RSA 1199]|nr:hypothetical protein IW148_004086 [Coemansia sp. RSA 1199]
MVLGMECLRDMEIQASEIRESSNWIHQIVQKCQHIRNKHSEDYTLHDGSTDVPYMNDCGTCVVAQNEDIVDTEDDGPSYELDGVPLMHRFGSHVSMDPAESNCSNVCLDPAESNCSNNVCLDPQPRSPNPRFKLCMLLLAHAAMVGYLCALWQLLADQMSSPFTWHPILMSVSLVLATESVIIMQYAEWPVPTTHKPTRIFHYIAHTLSFLLQIAGIVHATQSASMQSSTQSAHRVVGSLAALLFGGQMVFGIYMGVASMGRQKHAKWYKYHRAAGYVVLGLQWAGAWLGVHSKWVQAEQPSEWTWLLVFAALVVGVLVPVDMSKFGFRQRI